MGRPLPAKGDQHRDRPSGYPRGRACPCRRRPGLGQVPDVRARRARGEVPSPPRRGPPLPERQRPPRPDRGRLPRKRPRPPTVWIGGQPRRRHRLGWGANLDVGTDELRAVYRMPYSKRTMARSPTCSPSHALDPPRVASRSATPWTASTPTDSTDRYQDLEHSGAQGPGTSPYRALSLRPPRLFRRFPLSPLERGEGAPLKYRPASDRR